MSNCEYCGNIIRTKFIRGKPFIVSYSDSFSGTVEDLHTCPKYGEASSGDERK